MGLADYLASLGYEENANAEFEDPSGRSLAQPKEEISRMKVCKLKEILRRRGYSVRPGRGSHTVWTEPTSGKAIVLCGSDGDDAQPYLVARVCKVTQKGTR
jgi:predicted RNA binding protein YcfA (HicA-like mRNA interferase family)